MEATLDPLPGDCGDSGHTLVTQVVGFMATTNLEVRMTGDLVLMSKKSYPATYVTSRHEIEHQVAMEANHAFGKLVSDNRFIYDPAQKRLTYRSMLVSRSTTPNLPATAIGVEASSPAPQAPRGDPHPQA
jgi:hypothetical protein